MNIRYRRVDQTLPYNHPDCYKDYWIEADGKVVGYVVADRPGRSAGTFAHWMAYRMDDARLCPVRGTFKALKQEIGWALAKDVT